MAFRGARSGGAFALAAVLCVAGPGAMAACPQKLAVYESADGSLGLAFRGHGEAVAMSHELDLLLDGMAPVTAYVETAEPLGQPVMIVPYNCPQGDVTGEELARCIVYRSVVYAVGEDGTLGELPGAAAPAARQILLPNLVGWIWGNPAFKGAGPARPPAEIVEFKGCQE